MDEDLAYERAKEREIDDYIEAHEDFDSVAHEPDEPPDDGYPDEDTWLCCGRPTDVEHAPDCPQRLVLTSPGVWIRQGYLKP
jgi:hypothetical protein